MINNKYNIKKVIFEDYFHGEALYSCPHCNNKIEFYDFQFERGVTRIEDNIYKCGKCKQLIKK